MTERVFNNPEVVAQSWYVAARSRAVRAGSVVPVEVGGRQMVLLRDRGGAIRAADAFCPHLGAWLGRGRVVDGELECAFHGWRFGADGACVGAPGCARIPRRSMRMYHATERWGVVWVFTGPAPNWELPESAYGARAVVVRLPRQRIACHPHLVIANGLDVAHYETLHGMEFTAPPTVRAVGPCALELELSGRARERLYRILTGTTRRDIAATFTTYGCSVALARVTSPVDLEVVFTAMPDGAGGCVTQTLVLLPALGPARVARAALLMAMLLREDRGVLDTIRFRGAFGERDASLAAFRDLVDALPPWCEAAS